MRRGYPGLSIAKSVKYLDSKGISHSLLHLTATTTAPVEVVTIARLTVSSDSVIIWGDGSSEVLVAGSTAAINHTYTVAGTYYIAVENATRITQLQLDSAKIGGLNTAELKYSQITYFLVTLITGSTIRSADMTAWRPGDWRLSSMPAGTYSISSADMTAWRPINWYLYSMPAGTYSISSADMTAWRPGDWRLSTMPAGTYSISSADMVDWRPTIWQLSSMPAGTYSISSADMVAWRPAYWRLYSMPAAGSSYTFAASCMRNWTSLVTLAMNDLGLDAATVDAVLADIYAGRMGYIAAAPTANLGGSNADPNGVYQAMVPPTTGNETRYELVNDSAAQGFHKWAITI